MEKALTENKERNQLLKSVGFSEAFITKLENYDAAVYQVPNTNIEELSNVVDAINISHDLVINENTYQSSLNIIVGE